MRFYTPAEKREIVVRLHYAANAACTILDASHVSAHLLGLDTDNGKTEHCTPQDLDTECHGAHRAAWRVSKMLSDLAEFRRTDAERAALDEEYGPTHP